MTEEQEKRGCDVSAAPEFSRHNDKIGTCVLRDSFFMNAASLPDCEGSGETAQFRGRERPVQDRRICNSSSMPDFHTSGAVLCESENPLFMTPVCKERLLNLLSTRQFRRNIQLNSSGIRRNHPNRNFHPAEHGCHVGIN